LSPRREEVEASRGAREAPRRRATQWWGPLALSLLLLAYGNLTALIPWDIRSRYLLFANLALLAVLLFEAIRVSCFSLSSLGLGRGNIWKSARSGAVCSVLLAATPIGFMTIAPFVTGQPVEYGDLHELSAGAFALRMALWEPLGTALFEETAFRGLYAKIAAVSNETRAIWASSVVFALWHGVITSRTVIEGNVVDIPWLLPPVIVVCLGGTMFGGLVFAFLRQRTGHIAGPFMVHWLTVALMSLAVWARA
jgi:membrane protease YdiL (CAAX protease family)